MNVDLSNVDARNRNVNVNRSGNVNVNRDVDIDVGHGPGWDWGAAVRTAAVVGTEVAVGSYVASQPTGCSSVCVGGMTYQQCGSTYYMPAYQGSTLTYQVVPAP